MSLLLKHREWRVVAALAFLAATGDPHLIAQQAPPKPAPAQSAPQPAAKPPAAKPAAQSAAQQQVDGGWPRGYTTPSGGEITLYQPQIASWTNQKQMVGYAAAAYRAKGAPANEKPALGTLKLEADTAVSLETRLVNFERFRITESNFSTLQKEQTREIVDELTKAIAAGTSLIALDRILANIDHSQIVTKTVEGLKSDPPVILFSKSRAVLVNFDSDPIWSPIKGNDLKFAVNTNWDLFEHSPTKTYYLRNTDTWLKATDLKGTWEPAGTLPKSFSALPAEENWTEVKANLPGKPVSGQAPKVFVSTQPAELILLRGEPSYLLVEGTKLLWVNNTESDVFRLGKTGPIYYLVTGRWFSAPDFTGPWTFATPTLPEDFKRIPVEHERSRVLASVPGTTQAAEGILLANVPQTAKVDRKNLKAPDVMYQGDAQFTPIEGTSVARAVNTDKDIIKYGDDYYMCYEAVWFVSKSASGPWEVASTVPEEIYKIPAGSPAHNVTYVTIEESSSDSVTVAYTAGYTGMMVGWGCAVWGTGWYYPPYVYYGGMYPVYYPYFPTYGYSAWYNPWTGTYGRSAVAYGPYGGVGAGARYNPRTGTYARGATAWGPYGSRSVASAWNPRTGAYGHTRQGSNVYGSWGSSYVQRGDDWAQTKRVTNRATGNTTRVTRTDEGGAISHRGGPGGGGFVAGGEGGNVYAGHDGNVYRKQDGNWQKYDNGGWNSAERPQPQGDRSSDARSNPSTTTGQLDRDSRARSEGATRTNDYGSYRSGGGASRGMSGSYRAPRGGGGRRR